MRRMTLAAGVAIIAGACAAPAPSSFDAMSGELVDLSHAYDDNTIYWPTSDRFRLERVSEGVTPAGYYYAANNLFTAEQTLVNAGQPVDFVATCYVIKHGDDWMVWDAERPCLNAERCSA